MRSSCFSCASRAFTCLGISLLLSLAFSSLSILSPMRNATLEAVSKPVSAYELVFDLISYFIGCIFGRWDIRLATGELSMPQLPDPFAPLPVCSPGMLTNDDGLPLRETLPQYPLEINWEGILVDD